MAWDTVPCADYTDRRMTMHTIRESWLNDALNITRNFIADKTGDTLPLNCRVSCGWPGGGSPNKRIGECWPPSASKDGTTEIFISPILADGPSVLAVLVHEAVHATVGNECGHKGPFKRLAVALGLEGKMTATVAGDALKSEFTGWLARLGEYPHALLDPSKTARKKQSARQMKVQCSDCGYVARVARKWLTEAGAPICPCNGKPMASDDADDSDDDGEGKDE